MAGSNNCSNGSLPSFSCSAAQPATTPGTVTASQPRLGCTASPSGPVPYLRLKYSTFHAAGATPDEFRPCNCRPSQTMAKQSPPSPQDTGSTSTMVAAAAMAASTALPPVAALEQHTQAGLRRQRVRGGHDIAGEDGNAGGRVRIDPIEGFHLMISIDSAGTS
ncbi:Uncharacterised protein [Bordetella pertussis]|nr:Uncharacterised protein [Bordetella pertussis]